MNWWLCCTDKGKKSFGDISLKKTPKVTINISETSHGKNVCDGLRAIVKNSCYQAVVSIRKVIGTALDVFHYCEERLQSKSMVFQDQTHVASKQQFVFVSNIKKWKKIWLIHLKELHSVRSTGNNYQLDVSTLSCYCQVCSSGSNFY